MNFLRSSWTSLLLSHASLISPYTCLWFRHPVLLLRLMAPTVRVFWTCLPTDSISLSQSLIPSFPLFPLTLRFLFITRSQFRVQISVVVADQTHFSDVCQILQLPEFRQKDSFQKVPEAPALFQKSLIHGLRNERESKRIITAHPSIACLRIHVPMIIKLFRKGMAPSDLIASSFHSHRG